MIHLLQIIDKFSHWSGKLIAPVVFVNMLIITYEVVSRYGFNSPTKWVHETSAYIFGAQFMLAGAYCLRERSMVNVDIIYNRIPVKARSILDLFLLLIPLLICIVLVVKGWNFFWTSFMYNEHSGTVFNPPIYPLKAVIPLSALMLFIQVIAKYIRILYFVLTGTEIK